MKQQAHLIWGLILAAIGGLGTIKTLMMLSTGTEFTLQKAAFYVGAAAVITYFGVAAAIMAGGAIALTANFIGGDDLADALFVPIVVVGGAFGLLLTASILFSDWLIYENIDSFGRGALALLGLGVLAWTIHMFRKDEETAPAA